MREEVSVINEHTRSLCQSAHLPTGGAVGANSEMTPAKLSNFGASINIKITQALTFYLHFDTLPPPIIVDVMYVSPLEQIDSSLARSIHRGSSQ